MAGNEDVECGASESKQQGCGLEINKKTQDYN